MKTSVGELRALVRRLIAEVNTDPSDNPGRPDDPHAYIGMHPDPGWAMAHPALGGAPVSLTSEPATDGTDGGTEEEIVDEEDDIIDSDY